MIARGENSTSLANKSLDELTNEITRLPEGSEQVRLYHDEIIRRQEQADLDETTSGLVAAPRKFSIWTILVLGAAVFAFAASIMLQK